MFDKLTFKDTDTAMKFASKLMLMWKEERISYVAMLNRIKRHPEVLAQLLTTEADIIAPHGFSLVDTVNNHTGYWTLMLVGPNHDEIIYKSVGDKPSAFNAFYTMEGAFAEEELYPVYEDKEHEYQLALMTKAPEGEELWYNYFMALDIPLTNIPQMVQKAKELKLTLNRTI